VPQQLHLFGAPRGLPEGFRYAANLVTADEERAIASRIARLDLKPFRFHGYVGKRRVASFGWKYDFDDRALGRAEPVPEFLLPLRAKAAAWAGLPPTVFEHALVTEYAVGAEIGWHKDRPEFGEVVGVSLLAPCRFRFRRRRDGKWERAALVVEPRSAYLLSGPARTEWEHSIPAATSLRRSITFRTLHLPPRD
jgi:alkylated DNA repair dioxygenase AlkB